MSGLRGWRMDFSSQLDTYLAGERKVNLDPPGFDASLAKDTTLSTFHGKREDPAAEAKLFTKKQEALWERAQAPIKQVAMMCFMIYMFCGSIQIFSLFFLVTGITTPITAILKSADVFPLDEASPTLDRLMPRIMYCVVQFGQLLFVAWRLNAIGLLPTHPSDWLSTLPVPKPFEQSFAAL